MDDIKEKKEFVILRKEEELTLVTVTGTEGSTYKKKGATKLIANDGSSVGIISGGCLENEVLNIAKEMKNKELNYSIDTRVIEDRLLGYAVGCQGVTHLNFKKVMGFDLLDSKTLEKDLENEIFVYVIGLGLDINPLKNLLDWTQWNTKYYSNKRDLVEKRKKEGWEGVYILERNKLLEDLSIPEQSAVLLMSHNYPTDLDALHIISALPIKYIGILGPSEKKKQMLLDLRDIYDIRLDHEKLKHI